MKKLILGLLASTLAMPVLAQPKGSLELVLGSAKQSAEFEGEEFFSGDDTSFAIRGTLNANEYLAVELGYHNYGEPDETYTNSFDIIHDEVNATAINLGLKGIIPLDANFAINARAGIASWDLEVKETDSSFPGVMFSYEDSGTDLYYGVGVQFKANEQLNVGVEYTVTNMKPSFGGDKIDYDVNNVAISLGYLF